MNKSKNILISTIFTILIIGIGLIAVFSFTHEYGEGRLYYHGVYAK